MNVAVCVVLQVLQKMNVAVCVVLQVLQKMNVAVCVVPQVLQKMNVAVCVVPQVLQKMNVAVCVVLQVLQKMNVVAVCVVLQVLQKMNVAVCVVLQVLQKMNVAVCVLLQVLQKLGKADETKDAAFEESVTNFNKQMVRALQRLFPSIRPPSYRPPLGEIDLNLPYRPLHTDIPSPKDLSHRLVVSVFYGPRQFVRATNDILGTYRPSSFTLVGLRAFRGKTIYFN